jgi:PhzF family phenazine biosynthesis protein
VEDPVTGTASGVLGAYHREFIQAGASAPLPSSSPLIVEQGQEVGRDGRVSVWVDTRGEGHHVRVGGTGCFVRELEIELPHE